MSAAVVEAERVRRLPAARPRLCSQTCGRRSFLLLVLSCLLIGAQVAYDSPGAIAPFLKRNYGIEGEKLGILYASYHVPNIVLVIFSGLLMDSIGSELGGLGFSMVVLVSSLIFSLTTSFMGMVTSRVVLGVGGEALNVAQNALLNSAFGGPAASPSSAEFPSLEMSYGISTVIPKLGSLLMLQGLPLLVDKVGWEGTWLVAGICALSLLFSILLYLMFKGLVCAETIYAVQEEQEEEEREGGSSKQPAGSSSSSSRVTVEKRASGFQCCGRPEGWRQAQSNTEAAASAAAAAASGSSYSSQSASGSSSSSSEGSSTGAGMPSTVETAFAGGVSERKGERSPAHSPSSSASSNPLNHQQHPQQEQSSLSDVEQGADGSSFCTCGTGSDPHSFASPTANYGLGKRKGSEEDCSGSSFRPARLTWEWEQQAASKKGSGEGGSGNGNDEEEEDESSMHESSGLLEQQRQSQQLRHRSIAASSSSIATFTPSRAHSFAEGRHAVGAAASLSRTSSMAASTPMAMRTTIPVLAHVAAEDLQHEGGAGGGAGALPEDREAAEIAAEAAAAIEGHQEPLTASAADKAIVPVGALSGAGAASSPSDSAATCSGCGKEKHGSGSSTASPSRAGLEVSSQQRSSFCCRRESRRGRGSPGGISVCGVNLSTVGRACNTSLILCTAIVLFWCAAHLPYQEICTALFAQEYGYSDVRAAQTTSVQTAVNIATMIPASWVLNKYRCYGLMITVGLAFVIPAHTFLAVAAPIPPEVSAALMGFGGSAISTAVWPALGRLVPLEVGGTIYGLVSCGINTVLVAAPLFVGYLRDRKEGGGFAPALWCIITLECICVLLTLAYMWSEQEFAMYRPSSWGKNQKGGQLQEEGVEKQNGKRRSSSRRSGEVEQSAGVGEQGGAWQ